MSRVQISKRIIAINSAGTVVRAVLSVTVLLWMHQHLIHRIDEDEYVLLPLVMAVMAFAPLLSTILIGGLARFVTEAYAKGDERRVTEITSSMAPLLWLAAVALLAFGGLLSWQIDFIVDIVPEEVGRARAMFMILMAAAALRVSITPFLFGFAIKQRFVARDAIGFAAELVRLGLLVYLLTQHGATVLWIPVATFVATALELGVTFRVSRRLVPALRFERSAIRRDVIKPIISFGGWTVIGKVSRLVREMSDPMILNRMATPGDLVAFNLGSQIDRQFRRTLFSVTMVAQPAATAMAATDQMERLRNLWFRMSRYTLIVMLALAVPLIIYREEFYALWLRDKFLENRDAAMVTVLLLVRYVAIFPNAAVGLVTTALAKVRLSSVHAAIMEFSNLGVTLLFVGALQMGAIGAAAATCVVATLGQPLMVWRLGMKITGTRFSEWFRRSIVPGLAPGLGAAPVWLALQHFAEPSSWVGLTACGLGGGVVYLALTLALAGPDDWRDLRRFYRGREARTQSEEESNS